MMTNTRLAIAVALLLAITGGIASAQVPGTGRVKVKSIQTYSGAQTLTRPATIVVYDFATSDDEVELNKGALNRVRTRIKRDQDDEKTKMAHKVAESFSRDLIKDLEKSGIPVVRGVAGEPATDGSLAVHGDFMLIDEGNRARRMVIGLGSGASKVEAHVECFAIRPAKNALLAEFTATSESSRKPGAAETMAVGTAPEVAGAVSGATELKQDAEGDVSRLAKAVAKEINKSLKSQGWVEESK